VLGPALGRASYLFNATIPGIEAADALIIIGANPRKEAAVLNARIRKRWRMGGFPIGVIGERADLTYPYDHLGAGAETLGVLAAERNSFVEILKQAARPLVLIGQGAFSRPDGAAIAALAAKLAVNIGAVTDEWNGFCVLHTAASRVGALEIGFVPTGSGKTAVEMANPGVLDVAFLLGADEIDIAPGTFVVYIGSHGDRGAHRADVILAGAAYPEKSGLFLNTEGRVQIANRAAFPPGDAREDWAILRALSDVLDRRLPYDSLGQLRASLVKAHPELARTGAVLRADAADLRRLAGLGGTATAAPFRSPVTSYYLTNPIARASAVMAECAVLASGAAALTAAE
jgi:NADH-quinone oxidoreductase subunit G